MNRDDVIRMVHEAGMGMPIGTESLLVGHEWAERFAALVAAHEREECARVCDEVEDQAWAQWKAAYKPIDQGRSIGAEECAFAIRERGGNE